MGGETHAANNGSACTDSLVLFLLSLSFSNLLSLSHSLCVVYLLFLLSESSFSIPISLFLCLTSAHTVEKYVAREVLAVRKNERELERERARWCWGGGGVVWLRVVKGKRKGGTGSRQWWVGLVAGEKS